MAKESAPRQTRPAQQQRKQPGVERKMKPRPASHARQYKPADKLEGKVVVVTGGDSGIGRAVAAAFAREGADVAILYLDEHGDADEVAPCYVFLASDDSSYFTGQVLHPNGGEVING